MKTLKDIIVEVQHGNEAAKKELYTRFLPLDLWEYFWKCAMTYDPKKADHFPACVCKRLHLHVNYLLRSCWKQHKMEGQSLD